MIKENKILDILGLLRLLRRNLLYLILIPTFLAGAVFLLTRERPQEFASETVIYTGLASGYSIENTGDSRIDFFGVNNAFDNLINIIKSRATLENTGLMLLSHHLMLEEPDPYFISAEHLSALKAETPQEVMDLVDRNSLEDTYAALEEYKNRSEDNYVNRLLNLDHPHYSVRHISGIKVMRVQNSDLLKINYTSNDAGIARHTLEILTSIFIHNFTGLKERQTDAVVRYFENQLAKSQADLDDAEDALLNFNKENRIINYHEQTKFIAAKKEDLELEYQQTMMTLKGAEAVVKNLEERMDEHSKLMLSSERVISLRNQLNEVTGQIATSELRSGADTTFSNRRNLQQLTFRSDQLKQDLRDAVDSLFRYSSLKTGLSTRAIFDKWLENVIIFEESTASMDVLEERKEEFARKYDTFAPLGANLKRIERLINVSEQEYLSLLHSLALAKLKQQNIELSSNLKVVDEPVFPLKPLPDKRKFLIIIAFMGGFVFMLFIILVIEYLDQNIRSHERAAAKTGYPVAGMYPLLHKHPSVNTDKIRESAVDLLMKKVQLCRKNVDKEGGPHIVMVYSTRDREGKSTVCKELGQGLKSFGFRVLYLNYDEEENFGSENYDYLSYDSKEKCFTATDFNEIVYNGERKSWSNYDFIFWEVPSITHNFYPFNLVEKIDSALLVVRANRPWTAADSNALSTLVQIKKEAETHVVLNGVEVYEMESIVGELPRRRTLIRVLIKRVLTLQFHSKKAFG